jgi:hypothetical protein
MKQNNFKEKNIDIDEKSSTLSWERLLQHSKCYDMICQIFNLPSLERGRILRLFRYLIMNSVKVHGIKWTCSELKSLERDTLLGRPAFCSIPGMKKFFKISNNEKINLTLYSIHRNMTCTPKLDVSTIKRKLKLRTIKRINDMEDEIRKVLSHRFFAIEEFGRIFYKKDTRLKTYMDRKKDNPYSCDPTIDTNGRTGGDFYPIQISFTKRANGTCFDSHTSDFNALINFNRQLFVPIKRIWREWNYKLRKSSFQTQSNPSKVLSRVVPIRDKSCKTRVIAIFDSLSQIALRPVHKMLEDVLRNIPTDFTFNHLDGVKYLQRISKDRECFSVDIKSATDTVPVLLSKKIISILINSKIVERPETFVNDLFSILTDRLFHLENGKTIRYGVGQPMGAYASFPLLAITNHVLVQIAAHRAGIHNKFFKLYAVVGDDVVICCRKTAEQYYQLLEELDIPISKHKCLTEINSFEFCHRVVRNGNLVSLPSWNSYFRSLMSSDPTPIMTLCRDYGVALRYTMLCSFFKRTYIRAACSFQEYSFPDVQGHKLAVRLLPANVIGHAVRCLEIRDVLRKKNICEPLETNDNFLNRLNYSINIQKMFRDQAKKKYKIFQKTCPPFPVFNKKAIKKDGLNINDLDITSLDKKYIIVKTSIEVSRLVKVKPVWDIAHKVVANTFYLNYLSNFRDRKRLYRRLFSTCRGSNGSSIRLRAYCMSQRSKWTDNRLFGPVSQDKVIQTVANFPSGKK